MLKKISQLSKLSKYFQNKSFNSFILSKNKVNNKYLFTLQNKYLYGSFFLKYEISQKKNNFKGKMTKQQMFKAQQEQLMKQDPDQDPTTYNKSTTHTGKIVMAIGILAIISVLIYIQNNNKNIGSQIDQNISGMEVIKQEKKIKIGSQWSLVDQNGKQFSSSDLEGSYFLIYFGFTKCPDICPMTLIKLSRVFRLIRKMPQYNYLNLKMVFVSCDPQRDTPQRMKQYLKNFDDQIIGVTSIVKDDIQLKNCMKGYKIYANKIPLQNGQYSIDHTTITYLMDQNNQYVDHLNPTLTQQQMAKAVVNRILTHDYKKIQKRKNTSSSNQNIQQK